MVNKQRVRRIKNLIYAFIILVLFLPLILMSILSFRMIGLAEKMSAKLDDLKTTVSQAAKPAPSAPDNGYVIEPDSNVDLSSEPAIAQKQSNDADKAVSVDEQTASGSQLGADGEPIVDESDVFEPSNVAGDTVLGDKSNGTVLSIDDSSIKDAQGGTVISDATKIGTGFADVAINSGTSESGGTVNNPQTGDSEIPQKNYNGNPLMGRY